MIPSSQLSLSEGIYTYVAKSGENIDVASERLYRWTQARLDEMGDYFFFVPVDPNLALKFLHSKSVCPFRIQELVSRWGKAGGSDSERIKDFSPIIFGEFTDDNCSVLLIDGHHRYTVFALLKIPQIPSLILPRTAWEQFRVSMPRSLALTEAELRALPMKKRSY